MDKIISGLLPVLFLALFLWLSGLSYLTYYIFKNIKRLGKGVRSGNLLKILDEIKKSEDFNKEDIKKINNEIGSIKHNDLEHFQKMGLHRFNPFNETGGDHSFSLCLLDDKDSGFVISCLHARDRTRVYAKPIENGKSKIKLSSEEEKALIIAKK
jgi:hypothetical protein